MAQRIDVEKLYRQARRRMPQTIDTAHPLPVPDACPHQDRFPGKKRVL
jgi:hypothetical protein